MSSNFSLLPLPLTTTYNSLLSYVERSCSIGRRGVQGLQFSVELCARVHVQVQLQGVAAVHLQFSVELC